MIYFLACDAANAVKIGFTVELEKRLSQHATSNPFPLRLIGTLPGTVAEELEIHRCLVEHKVHREWFKAEAATAFFEDACATGIEASVRARNDARTLERDAALQAAYEGIGGALEAAIETQGAERLSANTGIKPERLRLIAVSPNRIRTEEIATLSKVLGAAFSNVWLGPLGMGAQLMERERKGEPQLFEQEMPA